MSHPGPSTDLTVATWNLHEGIPVRPVRPGTAREVAEEVGALLNEHMVDVVAFQEMEFDDVGRSAVLDSVCRGTELRHTATHTLHASSFHPDRLSGVALASRYPLRDIERHVLPNPDLRTTLNGVVIRSHDKGFVSARAEIAAQVVDLVSLHSFPFHLFDRRPEEEAFGAVWASARSGLAGLNGSRLVVCGDFNTANRDLLVGDGILGLSGSTSGRPTYRGEAVDDILYGPGILLRDAALIENFSDHEMCLATLRVEP